MTIYSKRQIAEMLGRPIRTITYWADEEIIHTDDPRERRPGRARQFSERNLMEFAMTDILSKLGIENKTIKFVMGELQPGKVVKDFFNDPKWGNGRELIFLELIDRSEKSRKVIPVKNENTLLEFVGMNPVNPRSIARIIWLGEIKNQAETYFKDSTPTKGGN